MYFAVEGNIDNARYVICFLYSIFIINLAIWLYQERATRNVNHSHSIFGVNKTDEPQIWPFAPLKHNIHHSLIFLMKWRQLWGSLYIFLVRPFYWYSHSSSYHQEKCQELELSSNGGIAKKAPEIMGIYSLEDYLFNNMVVYVSHTWIWTDEDLY